MAKVKMSQNTDRSESFMSLSDGEAMENTSHILASAQQLERWKYTKSSDVLELFLDTNVGEENTVITNAESASIHVSDSGLKIEEIGRESPIAAFGLRKFEKINKIQIDGNLEEPVTLTQRGQPLPLLIEINDNASCQLHEFVDCEDNAAVMTWIKMGKNSSLIHARNSFQETGKHWQVTFNELESGASYTMHNHVKGSETKRQDILINLTGSDSNAKVISAGTVNKDKKLDLQIICDHSTPRTTSHQRIDHVAFENGSTTFNGRIHILEHASGCNAQLKNRSLAMGSETTINAKPELEIYNDDVQCSHGSTIGQIDETQLFYMRSRGIEQKEAHAILCEGFLRETISGPLSASATSNLIPER